MILAKIQITWMNLKIEIDNSTWLIQSISEIKHLIELHTNMF